MSSLHQDRLLVEGSGPVTGTVTTLPTTRASSRRVVGDHEEKATRTAPKQRLGKAQHTGSTQSSAATPAAPRAERATGAKAAALGGTLASRARAATVKAASAKAATAKAATVKAATAKAATAKAATAKAATAARAAAVKGVANRTAGVRSARAATAATTPAAKAASATTPVTTKGAAAPARPAAAKSAAARSAPAKPAAVKAAPAKPPAAKPAAVMPAAGKPAATATAPAKPAPAARSAAAKAPAAKAPAAKPATTAKTSSTAEAALAGTVAASTVTASAAETTPAPVAATATATATRVRPTPHKRTPAAAPLAQLVPLVDVADLNPGDVTDVVVVRKDVPADPALASAPGGRLPLVLRRRPAPPRRRPALYMAAAMAAAISLSAFTPEEPTAQATATVSQSVSVAEQLGIEAAHPDAFVDATERLGELAATRNTRDAEQAAAAQAQAEADRIAAEAAAAAAAEAARPKAVMPVDGARLTSGFGARWGTLHAGIDLAAPMHTPEYAVMDGVVLEAGPASGYGLVVYIQHENGDVTVYGHMDKILVQAGQVVRAGDTIALLGNRGQSTGPHLHFEVQVGGLDGKKVDPLPWLRDKGVAI